jgi:DNA polymerase III subunit delta
MPSKPAAAGKAPLVLICGEEGLLVRQRAKDLFEQWSGEIGGMDHERIDASASHSGEALRAIGRLRESLQTLPFFGSGKVIWFEGCTFLGDDRTSQTQAVTETLTELAAELASFRWEGVRLIISAGKVDKRRTFYRTIHKVGTVEEQEGLSAGMRDWELRAESLVQTRSQEAGKAIQPAAAAALVTAVGPNLGQLFTEVDKLATYIGERTDIQEADVAAVAVRNKQARAFALGDALGDRNLAILLRALDEELWEMRGERSGGEIAVLYGLLAKLRALLLAKGLVEEGKIRAGAEYYQFKAQLERLPPESLGSDRRYNPRLLNPYVVYRAAQQAANYTREELVLALERLMECGFSLMSSPIDASIVLQQALVEICQRQPGGPASAPPAPPRGRTGRSS